MSTPAGKMRWMARLRRTARKPRRSYHHGNLRSALLDEALATIRAEGVDGVTLREIGARLGVSRTALYRHFADRTQLGFGIGTSLSNDVGLAPLNIVMKLTHCNGQPVAKLSDSPGKTMCDDQTFLAYLRQVFHIQEVR